MAAVTPMELTVPMERPHNSGSDVQPAVDKASAAGSAAPDAGKYTPDVSGWGYAGDITGPVDSGQKPSADRAGSGQTADAADSRTLDWYRATASHQIPAIYDDH